MDGAQDLGVIKLHLWRIKVADVTTRVQEHKLGRQTLEAQLVHERSKKAGSHHVQYVSLFRPRNTVIKAGNRFGQEYASPAPVIDVVQAKEIDTKPYLTFEFKYRPLSLLIANDIAPKILHMLSPSPTPGLHVESGSKNAQTITGPQVSQSRKI